MTAIIASTNKQPRINLDEVAIARPSRFAGFNILFFFEKGCSPCKELETSFRAAIRDTPRLRAIPISWIDGDKQNDLFDQYHVEFVPTILVTQD